MRTRLAIVLAVLMIGPLLAAGAAIGVVVPRVSRSAADDLADRAAAAAAVGLADRCRSVGETAQTVAQRLATALVGSGGESVSAAAAATALTDLRRPISVAVLAGPADARVLAATGPATGPATGSATGSAAAAGSPAGPPPDGVSCADRAAPERGTAALAETVPVTVGAGRVAARVVAWVPLDDSALRALRADLGIRADLTLLDTSAGTALTAAAGRHAVVADTARAAGPDARPDPRLEATLRAVADGAGSGGVDGARFRVQPGRPGNPFAVVAVARQQGGGLQGTLAALVLAGAVLCAGLVRLLAGRLTRPLVELTGIAERWRAGELGARSGIAGDDEVGRLGAALDAMAAELQTVVAELENNRDALSETFERFGEALGRTHDLDGLLQVLAEAALTGADAVVATALLGGPGGLEERAAAVDPVAEGAPPSLPPEEDGEPVEGSRQAVTRALATLAGLAISESHPVRVERLPGVGPAVALPLRREDKVIGVLTVARAAGAPSLDDTALAAVGALAAHAGTAVGNVLAHEEARRLSVTDPLTGAGNVRQLSTTLSREVERAHRFGRPLSVLMLDLDHFKLVNDTHGHDYGDQVLREFARRLAGCLREVDTVARYGGEEFAVVLPETDSEGATRVAERILEAIRAEPFGPVEQPWVLTTSIGIASYPVHGRVAAEVLRSADTALYTAKRDGRDRWAKAKRATRSRAVSQAG